MVFWKKALWVGTIWPSDLQGYWTKVHRTFFAERGRNRGWLGICPIMNICIRSGDIRCRSLNLSEIGPNFACFWPLQFFWGRSFKILDRHYKILLLIIVQHFAPIGWWSLEVSRWNNENKTFVVKHKSASKAIASGQTNKKFMNVFVRASTKSHIPGPRK